MTLTIQEISDRDFTTLARSDVPGYAIRNRGGGRYADDLARTAAGWRITRRRGTGKWNHQDRVRFAELSAR